MSFFKERKLAKFCLIFVVISFLSGCELYMPQKRNGTWASYQSAGTLIVRKGDTVYSLAKRNRVPLRDFVEYNRLRAPFTLRVGRRLRIPKMQRGHIVQKGETLYSISQRYQVSLSSLVRENQISPPYQIQKGQYLSLPQRLYEKKKTKWIAKSNRKQTPSKKRTKSAKQPTYQAPSHLAGKFLRPTKGAVLSSFGSKGKGKHNDGVNIAAKRGSPVLSTQNGVIVYVGDDLKSFGNLILIKHARGYISAYAHTEKVRVKKGQKVKKGQRIASVGMTGSVKRPQLHFEIRKGTKALNPMSFVK